jgi:catechol 2,3-dioxygenase-like lactoylglutathione lyase family enzyme
MSALDRIDHVTITVSDIRSTVNWYETSFECEVVQFEPTIAVLRFENVKLVLTLPSQERPHIGYQKKDADSFGELQQMKDGSLGTYISDPTGNIVELVKV